MGSLTNLTDACDGCPGRCCTRRFWTSVHLTKNESRNPVFKGKVGFNVSGEPVIWFNNRACPFLNQNTGKCKIYDDRPMACRGYVCHTAGGHSTKVIYRFPALMKHLKRKGLLPPDKSFFYLEGEKESVWHLRELRGAKNKDVGRFNFTTGRYEIIGRFGRNGKFKRRTKSHVRF
jgi:Fe-S-cluster containining protein